MKALEMSRASTTTQKVTKCKAKYSNGFTYEGVLDEMLRRSGFGSLFNESGITVYTGEWMDDKRHGNGTEYYDSKTINGAWKYGRLFEAQIVDTAMDIYEGAIDPDTLEPHGDGCLLCRSNSIYCGEWCQGALIKGTLAYSNGDVYTGNFRNRERNDFGKYKSVNGDTYIGTWKDNLPHGFGTCCLHRHPRPMNELNPPNNERLGNYIGYFRNGKRCGQGRMLLHGSSTDLRGYTYDGQWYDDLPHGSGRLESPQGSVCVSGIWECGVLKESTPLSQRIPNPAFRTAKFRKDNGFPSLSQSRSKAKTPSYCSVAEIVRSDDIISMTH